MSDALRKRFGETAELVAQQQGRRTAATQERLRHLLTLRGEERALDIGTGAGALAIVLAPLVHEVIGVDIVPELVEEGRKRAPANVELVEADATALPYGPGSFDLVCTARTLHHVPRPELALAEMNRLLRPGGTMLVADQLAPSTRSPQSSLTASSAPETRRRRGSSPTSICAASSTRTASSYATRRSSARSATSNATLIWPAATATSASARGRWRPTTRAPRSAGTSSANPASKSGSQATRDTRQHPLNEGELAGFRSDGLPGIRWSLAAVGLSLALATAASWRGLSDGAQTPRTVSLREPALALLRSLRRPPHSHALALDREGDHD